MEQLSRTVKEAIKLDDIDWLISKLREVDKKVEAWSKGPVTEAMLREHDGYLHLDRSVELARAGTTKLCTVLEQRLRAHVSATTCEQLKADRDALKLFKETMK